MIFPWFSIKGILVPLIFLNFSIARTLEALIFLWFLYILGPQVPQKRPGAPQKRAKRPPRYRQEGQDASKKPTRRPLRPPSCHQVATKRPARPPRGKTPCHRCWKIIEMSSLGLSWLISSGQEESQNSVLSSSNPFLIRCDAT